MAIRKVSQYNSTPTEITDYQAQNNYLQALINQSNGLKNILYQATTEIPTIFLGSYIAMGGTLYIVDTENYTILGTALGGDNYISVSVSGDNLIATWIQNISSYSWNNVYNYYSNGTSILLPYVVQYETEYRVFSMTNNLYCENISTKNGYLLQNEWSQLTSVTQDDFYTQFSNLIPNVGDILALSGFGYGEAFAVYESTAFPLCFVKRTSTTEMEINNNLTITSGSTVVIADYIFLAW